jgi:hypothetical protein
MSDLFNKKKTINLMNSDTLFSYPIAFGLCRVVESSSKCAKKKAARLYSSKKNINHLIMYLSTVKRDVAITSKGREVPKVNSSF